MYYFCLYSEIAPSAPSFFPSSAPNSYDCTYECMQYEYCNYPTSTPTTKPSRAAHARPTQKPTIFGQTIHPTYEAGHFTHYPVSKPTMQPTKNDCLSVCKKSSYCNFPANF